MTKNSKISKELIEQAIALAEKGQAIPFIMNEVGNLDDETKDEFVKKFTKEMRIRRDDK